MDIYELQALDPDEIYRRYSRNADPAQLFDQGRTDLAARLRVEEALSEDAAYYAADQILVYAQELLDRQPR